MAEQHKTALKTLKPFLPAGVRVHRRVLLKQEQCAEIGNSMLSSTVGPAEAQMSVGKVPVL
jgi:hypothetical protein